MQLEFVPSSQKKVVVAGYLNGSTKTLEPEHFTDLVGALPCMENLDVEVKNMNITDLTADPTKQPNPKDRVFAAHILCAEKDEEAINAALSNTYCKPRKASRATSEYPEGRNMKYIPLNMTGNIALTPKRSKKLQKNRITPIWSQEHQHPIKFIGFTNVYQPLTAPNGDRFSPCQVIMSIKCKDNYISPMFIAVDVSPAGDVVIYCDIDMKEEAEDLLSHFGIYLALIFGSVVWEAFTPQYKMRMDGFQYCPAKKRVVELDNSTIDLTETTYLDFTRMGFSEDLLTIPKDISFKPRHQFTLHVFPDVNGLLGDENGDSSTITSNCSDATLGTFRTAPSEPINYLIPLTITNHTSPTVPTTMPTNNNNSKDDAPMSQSPATTSSIEEALSSRPEGSSDD